MFGEFSLTSGLRKHTRPRTMAIVLEALEVRVTPSTAAGHWQGTVGQPGGPWEQFTISLDLKQTGSTVTGTERIEVVGQTQYYEARNVSGTATDTQVTLSDGAITSQKLTEWVLLVDLPRSFPNPAQVPSGTVVGKWTSGSEAGPFRSSTRASPRPLSRFRA